MIIKILELEETISKKSHHQTTEKLEKIQMKRTTSKTTKKNTGQKPNNLENLHI